MTIYSGSRYQGQTQAMANDAHRQASFMTIFPDPPVLPIYRGQAFNYYTVVDGDRFDLLANRFLGRPDLWWMIADMNPEISYPDQLPAGQIIRVPVS